MAMRSLSLEQTEFFVRNGFVHLPKVLSDEICTGLVDETWARLPLDWNRHDCSTWTGDLTDSCHTADLTFRRGLLKFQKGSLVDNPLVVAGFGPGSPVQDHASALIGRRLAPVRVRGLYPNVPVPDPTQLSPHVKPHVEAHPVQVVAIGYLEDVGPKAGGTAVWPGSHLPLYAAFRSRFDFAATDEYSRLYEQYNNLEPIVIEGEAGDVILMHHRLFHAPSINQTNRIRFAIFCDYTPAEFKRLCALSPESTWEDWPALRACVAAPDTVQSDYRLKPRDRQVVLAPSVQTRAVNDSTLNKMDASKIARLRQSGDVWIVLSNSRCTFENANVEPCGSDIVGQGVRVFVNAKEVSSQSRNDFINKIELNPGLNEIMVIGVREHLWLKTVGIVFPFMDSEVTFRTQIEGSAHAARILLNETGRCRPFAEPNVS